MAQDLETVKRWVLQSGYPLENDVQNILGAVDGRGAKVERIRDFSFEAQTEDGEKKIRSIDFKWTFSWPCHATEWRRGSEKVAKLTFLVDAKWSGDELWLFAPGSLGTNKLIFPSLLAQIAGEHGYQHFKQQLNALPECMSS